MNSQRRAWFSKLYALSILAACAVVLTPLQGSASSRPISEKAPIMRSGEHLPSLTSTLVCPCRTDFNGSNVIDVGDIFAFLNAWFAASPAADFDTSPGISVGDIFSFLNLWFLGEAGCPTSCGPVCPT